MIVAGAEIKSNLSPNGEYHRVRKYCERLAHAYREATRAEDKVLLAGELRKYGFLNINNNTGRWVICV